MTIGKIAEFNVQKDDWKLYIERLEQYFVVNEVKAELQVATLITVMGSEAYELLVNLCTPVKPKAKSFDEIIKIMERHLQPKPSELAERYKFRQRKQQSGETIAEYVAILKKMSMTCEFGNWLEESLRDQLVCGLNSETIRQRLFAETNINFARAYTLAVNLESAEKDAAIVVQGQRSTTTTTAECQSIQTYRKQTGASGTTAAAAGAYGNGARGSQRRVRAPATPVPARLVERAGGRRQQQCRACGGAHDTSNCKFGRYVCRVCNKEGHLRRMCPNLTAQHCVEAAGSSFGAEGNQCDSENSDEVTLIEFNQLAVGQCKPILISLKVNNKSVAMECDTGSAVSCISYDTYKQRFSDLPIKDCTLILRYYTGEIVRPLGVIKPLVNYNGRSKELDLYVIKNGKTLLLGRQWIAELNIQLPSILQYCSENVFSSQEFDLSTFSSRYCKVFADGLGCFTGPPVSIHVREGARPVFMRARPLAYALREPVERVLQQHVRDGILTPVERSDWATPIVPVVKKDGDIRICADYKITLNKVIDIDRYPLPRVEDLLVRLHGGKRFSKIDLSQAYAQLVLDETKKYTVINTHKGLFMYNRLVFGLSSSPGIFQRRLEELFADLPRVGVFLDDVIITGSSTEEHLSNLHKVFERLEKYGLRVKESKCEFFAETINYLGHVISEKGVHTCHKKVQAIMETSAPTNVSELRSFIGMIMYYSKFIKDVSTILAPMYELLKARSRFVWSPECQRAFERVKTKMSSSEVLVHYSAELPLVLTADASSVGVGAVLSHLTPDGERPVAYASRSLTAAERHYSQIDREALAIVYGIRKYHQYLYGRKFILRTDHKPLTYILGDKVGIPIMAASRLQRWAVLLSGYNYSIEYVVSKKNCADALSRLPAARKVDKTLNSMEITYSHFVENFLPITNLEVRKTVAKDVILSRVKLYIETGWPASCSDDTELKPYFTRRNELYVESGCIMWGYRMIIPTALRQLVLKQLHSTHMGIVKTKSWARSYVWWPQIDYDVEALCRACDTCALEAAAPPRAAPQPWPYHPQPWYRVHADFLGPYRGKTFFILVDSSSKWLETFEMNQTNAGTVIKVLRATFARFGLPVEFVSDQGPPFTSSDFTMFLKNNGVRQLFSPIYHPSSNGAAENAVKLCKRAIKKAFRDNVDIDAALQTFLLTYRNTVHSTTGETPAMLLQKRNLRTRLDLLRRETSIHDKVSKAQERQIVFSGGKQRELSQNETVWARGFGKQDKWLQGKVLEKDGSRRYIVDSGNGQLIKRHVDQIRRRSRLSDVPCPIEENAPTERDGSEAAVKHRGEVVDESSYTSRQESNLTQSASVTDLTPASPLIQKPASPVNSPAPTTAQAPPPLTLNVQNRPKREHKPVVRFGLEID